MTNATRLQLEARMDRFGLKLASYLDEQPLAHDMSERLRVARLQALAQRKKELNVQTSALTASSVVMSGGAALLGGGEGLNWFSRLASALPLLALIIGLITISISLDDDRANELAEVDMQLLTDDLPPAAHTDAGFAQYLKFGPPNVAGVAAGAGQ